MSKYRPECLRLSLLVIVEDQDSELNGCTSISLIELPQKAGGKLTLQPTRSRDGFDPLLRG